MKKLFYTLFVFYITSSAFAGVIRKEFEIVKGKQIILEMESGGSVFIKSWDQDKVDFKLEFYNIDQDEIEFDYDLSSSGLELSIDYDKHWTRNKTDIDVYLKIPQEIDIDIETAGGSVNIDGVKGQIRGQTMGGGLTFNGVSGDIQFKTFGGNINVSGAEGYLMLETLGGGITVVDSKVDGKVSTLGGKVKIENVDGNLKGSTLGGNVTYKNVTGSSNTSEQDEVQVTSMGGSIRIDEAPAGADLETMGGDIVVNSAKKYVRASTMGGDIEIEEIDGWIDLSTMGGDVTVKMVGDPDVGDRNIEIISKSGDIELTVPQGLSMDFDLELAYTKNARKNYKIISDFDIRKKETEHWESGWGGKRKFIYGTGEVGGGKHKVRISTVNGDIIIRKG